MYMSKHTLAIPPGETIKEMLDDNGISQKQLAIGLGVTEKDVARLIDGDMAVSPTVADGLERGLGMPARFWLRLEARYRSDIVKVEAENRQEVMPIGAENVAVAMA